MTTVAETFPAAGERSQAHALLDVLESRIIEPPEALWGLVTTYIAVARWLGVAPQIPRSPYGRALYLIVGQQLSRALQDLDSATAASVLKDASFFAGDALAPAIADEMAARNLIPAPRLAAQLVRTDFARCLALLERLDGRHGSREVCAIAVAEAYLAAHALGAVPEELVAIWRDLEARVPEWWAGEHANARLRIAALTDPAAALAALTDDLEHQGGAALGQAPAAVVAVTIDRYREEILELASVGWPGPRATVVEAIARVRPHDPELPALIDALLDEWNDHDVILDRSNRGAVELAWPLLGAALWSRDHARARAVATDVQPSRFMISSATWKPMRVTNLADRCWRPDIWDSLTAQTRTLDEVGVPELTDAEHAAWWKLETLPLEQLGWHDSRPSP